VLAWLRLLRKDVMTLASVPPEACSYLLFSDVHLGADLVQHARPWTASRLREAHRIDHQLGTMLDYYRERPDGSRPWCLVIAGDFIDLMSMSIAPAAGQTLATPLSEDDVAHGLGSAEDHAALKMRAVAERHDLLFRKLASFVAAGHSLVFVRGNHDVEFYWESTQRVFLDALLERCAIDANDQLARKSFEMRVEFRHWFYYVRGLLYVEHGHQYDETCAYHHVLAPRSPLDPRRISYSFSDILLRYVVRPTRELSSDGHEDKSLAHYLRFSFSLGLHGCAMLGYRFFGAVGRMVRSRREQLSEAAANVRAEHEQKLQQIASVFRVSVENLRAMTQLWAKPVTSELSTIFRSVFLDGLAAGFFGSLVLTVLAFVGVVPWTWFAPLMVAVLAGLLIYVRSRRAFEPHVSLRRGASKLAELMPARYVVMGHTHKPVMERLNDTSTYVNLGNWTADLLDDDPRPAPCTHLVIRQGQDGQPLAALCRWQGPQGAEVMSSDEVPIGAAAGRDPAAHHAPLATTSTAVPPSVG
jgi:UDP-2,3-diacylglucosamine pyrophosphatase LpxH